MLTLVGAVGRETIRLLEGAEMDLRACLALTIQADGLHLDDVIRLFLEVPEDAGPTGCVHLADEPLHVTVLPLRLTHAINEPGVRPLTILSGYI